MFCSQRLCSIIRRGTAAAGIRPRGGNGKRSASTGTKPSTGTNAATLNRAAVCNSYLAHGAAPEGEMIRQMLLHASSSIALISSGVVTVAPGASGQPRASAD